MNHVNLEISLSEFIRMNPFGGIRSLDEFEECEVPVERYTLAIKDVKSRLAVRIKIGKCSEVLVRQLARHSIGIYEKFGDEIHGYHMQSILDVLEQVDAGNKMNVRSFNKEPLKGLWHVHHNSNTFSVINMVNCWKEKMRQNAIKKEDEISFQNKLLDEIYLEFKSSYPEGVAKEKALLVLLHRIQYESKSRDQTKQTGEWVVFAKQNAVNYYLCLATHNEARKYSDDVIYERLEPCLDEFPEISSFKK